jgi:hypothetical protein
MQIHQHMQVSFSVQMPDTAGGSRHACQFDSSDATSCELVHRPIQGMTGGRRPAPAAHLICIATLLQVKLTMHAGQNGCVGQQHFTIWIGGASW